MAEASGRKLRVAEAAELALPVEPGCNHVQSRVILSFSAGGLKQYAVSKQLDKLTHTAAYVSIHACKIFQNFCGW